MRGIVRRFHCQRAVSSDMLFPVLALAKGHWGGRSCPLIAMSVISGWRASVPYWKSSLQSQIFPSKILAVALESVKIIYAAFSRSKRMRRFANTSEACAWRKRNTCFWPQMMK